MNVLLSCVVLAAYYTLVVSGSSASNMLCEIREGSDEDCSRCRIPTLKGQIWTAPSPVECGCLMLGTGWGKLTGSCTNKPEVAVIMQSRPNHLSRYYQVLGSQVWVYAATRKLGTLSTACCFLTEPGSPQCMAGLRVCVDSTGAFAAAPLSGVAATVHQQPSPVRLVQSQAKSPTPTPVSPPSCTAPNLTLQDFTVVVNSETQAINASLSAVGVSLSATVGSSSTALAGQMSNLTTEVSALKASVNALTSQFTALLEFQTQLSANVTLLMTRESTCTCQSSCSTNSPATATPTPTSPWSFNPLTSADARTDMTCSTFWVEWVDGAVYSMFRSPGVAKFKLKEPSDVFCIGNGIVPPGGWNDYLSPVAVQAPAGQPPWESSFVWDPSVHSAVTTVGTTIQFRALALAPLTLEFDIPVEVHINCCTKGVQLDGAGRTWRFSS